MNKNLFIISSPFQLINILELIHKKKWTNNFIVALYISNAEKNHIINTSKVLGTSEINYIHRKKFFAYFSIFKLGLKIKKVENFVFGHLMDNHHLFLSFLLKKNNSILVDDGKASISSYDFYKKNKYPKEIRSFLKYPENLFFFTVYELNNFDKKIIKNKLEYLQRISLSKSISNIVFFIGARVYNDIGERMHIEIIKEVAKSNPGLIYFPHRKETSSFINKLENSGINIFKEKIAFEVNLITSTFIPSKIIGFASSAFWNLLIINKKSFKGRLKFFFISLTNFPMKSPESLNFFKSYNEYLLSLGVNEYKLNMN